MKTIYQLIERIKQQNEKYGDKIQLPAALKEIEVLSNQVSEKYNIPLSEAYKNILLQTNGVDNDGVVIYASEKTTIIGYEDRYIDGFLEANEDWQSNDDFSKFLFLPIQICIYLFNH
jgi:hypothetical protein